MKARNYPGKTGILAFIILVLSTVTAFTQDLPQIEARFTNPRFESKTRLYFLDVELLSKQSKEFLFGMNVRFFYDASLMEFQHLDQFHQGYSLLGEAPKPFIGNDVSGTQMFNFQRAAGYVNGAIQLVEEQFAQELFPNKWVKAFRVCFKVPNNILEPDQFCPGVIWDVKPQKGAGGFLTGSDGLVITVTENNRDTRKVSAPTLASGQPFNWDFDAEAGLPHGTARSVDCITISELTSIEDQDIDDNGYALFQNQPNPFDLRTTIEFILPYAQEATLTFYSVNGTKMEEIRGDYVAGRNQIVLMQKAWMVQSNTIYYQLTTEKYTSQTRKMSLVRA